MVSAEESTTLPLTDIVTELRRSFNCRLIKPDLTVPAHEAALQRINHESAEYGQLDFASSKPEPMSQADLKKWAEGELGDFRFVQRILRDRHYRIIGEVHNYEDTHTEQVNNLLKSSGHQLQINPKMHTEVSTFVMKHANNWNEMDEKAGLLQLIDLFKLDTPGEAAEFETVAMYMDGVEESDYEMAKRLGFAVFVDGVPYENDLTTTAFIATRESVEIAARNWFAKLPTSQTT